MKKKPINPKDLEVNREFLVEQRNGENFNGKENPQVLTFTHCTPSEEEGDATLCVSETYCEPTENNCPATQGNGGNCQPITKQVGCVNTKNNCLTNAFCGNTNDICLETDLRCPVKSVNCDESLICEPISKNGTCEVVPPKPIE